MGPSSATPGDRKGLWASTLGTDPVGTDEGAQWAVPSDLEPMGSRLSALPWDQNRSLLPGRSHALSCGAIGPKVPQLLRHLLCTSGTRASDFQEKLAITIQGKSRQILKYNPTLYDKNYRERKKAHVCVQVFARDHQYERLVSAHVSPAQEPFPPPVLREARPQEKSSLSAHPASQAQL
ncbi:hypothetical protein TREES_T100021013 [Tupaia chinensis]|uniref:Uncharacterized protein n=1 Tax=Tupaia chinensis TaxID=246437 RepID=L9JCF8_TUPCH|nr:hypothetical protein TREES_T100021013 [Tupaia chinensis]